MSKITLGILFAAIGLVVLGTLWGLPTFSGGTGILIVAALVYAFHVAQREVLLLTRSMEVRNFERDNSRKVAPKAKPRNETLNSPAFDRVLRGTTAPKS